MAVQIDESVYYCINKVFIGKLIFFTNRARK